MSCSYRSEKSRPMTFTLERTPHGIDLVVRGPWSSRAAACLTSGHADGLVLNYARGFHEPDLSFITGLPIRRLNLLARSIDDLSPVYSLADGLVSLRVQSDPRALIDLERLPHLRDLAARWSQVRGSIRAAVLVERLFLLAFTERDLTPLTPLQALTSVNMKDYPRVRSLDGVDDLPHLEELGIHLGRYLEDITALERSPSRIMAKLLLPACRRISRVDAVASLPALRFFDLSDGATIPTIAPVADLVDLELLHLYGSTTIEDGDLAPIVGLPRLRDLRLQSRRHYTPPVREIQETIEGRARESRPRPPGLWRRVHESAARISGALRSKIVP